MQRRIRNSGMCPSSLCSLQRTAVRNTAQLSGDKSTTHYTTSLTKPWLEMTHPLCTQFLSPCHALFSTQHCWRAGQGTKVQLLTKTLRQTFANHQRTSRLLLTFVKNLRSESLQVLIFAANSELLAGWVFLTILFGGSHWALPFPPSSLSDLSLFFSVPVQDGLEPSNVFSSHLNEIRGLASFNSHHGHGIRTEVCKTASLRLSLQKVVRSTARLSNISWGAPISSKTQ